MNRVETQFASGASDRSEREEYVVEPFQSGDEESICRLFHRVFGKVKPLVHWRWQFGANPLGAHIFIARDQTGEVVGQFAGMPMRYQVDGKPYVFAHMVDNMIAPECRQGLRKSSLFARIVTRYVEHYGRLDGEAFGYGLPNCEALRLGRRFLRYSPLLKVPIQVKDLHPSGPISKPPHGVAEKSFPDDYEDLWSRSRHRYIVSNIRDSVFMHWRYDACPLSDYQILSARTDRCLDALGVYKSSYIHDGAASLVDLVWTGEDPESLHDVLEMAETLAREDGCRFLVGMVPPKTAEARILENRGYTEHESGYVLTGRTYYAPLTLEHAKRHWWYALGDFDLV